MAFKYGTYNKSDEVKKAEQTAQANSVYTESDTLKGYKDQEAQHNLNKPAEWTGGQYGTLKNDAYNAYANRDKFSYDLNGDALYQQYKNQYMTQGKLAMQDTIGQASAMTGGYGNSYAATAGNQAYQSYLQNLNDVVPQLYQLALEKYNQEGNELYNRYNMVSDLYNTEYGEHRDSVSDWYTEGDLLSNKIFNQSNLEWNQFDSNRTYYTDLANTLLNNEYGMWSDSEDRRANAYSLGLQEKQMDQSDTIAGLQAQLNAKSISDFKATLLTDDVFYNKAKKKGEDVIGGTRGNVIRKAPYVLDNVTYKDYEDYVLKQAYAAYEAGLPWDELVALLANMNIDMA